MLKELLKRLHTPGGVHRTCAETAAVSRGTSHVTTKQRCKHTTLADFFFFFFFFFKDIKKKK